MRVSSGPAPTMCRALMPLAGLRNRSSREEAPRSLVSFVCLPPTLAPYWESRASVASSQSLPSVTPAVCESIGFPASPKWSPMPLISSLQLAVFGNRIAWRFLVVPGEVLPRIWCIDNLPSDWHAHEVDQLLAQGFKDVTILSHRLVRGTQRYRFRAVCLAGDKDLVPVNVATDSGSICLWATLAPTRAFESKQRKLTHKPVPVIAHERTALEPQPDISKDSEVTETTEDGKTLPRAKHPRGSARVVPSVFLFKVDNPQDGNCAFSSFAQALQWLSKDGKKEYSHLELRTRVVSHLKKHKAEYEAEWDGIMPDGSKNPNFDDYLAATASAGSYASELELRALGRIYDTRILVLPADEAFKPMVSSF